MVKNIIHQQKEERDMLLGLSYIQRIGDADLKIWLGVSLIKLITGPRRSGKSVLALQLLQDQQFAYLNFDDDLLLKHFDEDEVIKALHEIYGNFSHLLLDEVQNLPDWELWVNKLYRRGVNLVITGSKIYRLPGGALSVLQSDPICCKDQAAAKITGKILHHRQWFC
jgi:uncharacterized protein